MKKEVRGLQAGLYWSEDDSAALRITCHDDGVRIEVGDFDADIFYKFTINEKQEAKFIWGQIASEEGE